MDAGTQIVPISVLPVLPGFRSHHDFNGFEATFPRLGPGSERPDMSWYAYCLTEQASGTRVRRPHLLEGVQGVNGAAVLSYPSGEFAVVVSEYDRSAGELDQKCVLEHARVVSACFRMGTVLPFRFGTIF